MDTKWIVKGLAESVLLVGSILLALAVDEWAQNRDYADLADQSLAIFEREIRQNQARLQDAAPYHQGIGQLLSQMRTMPTERMDVRPIMEGLEPPVLLSTAWETALATGALTHMEFDLVSALSMTYSIQEGFSDRNRAGLPRFIAGEAPPDRRAAQLHEANEYVAALIRDETELLSVFGQALELVAEYRSGPVSITPAGDSATAQGR